MADVTRRSALGTGALGVGVVALAACGSAGGSNAAVGGGGGRGTTDSSGGSAGGLIKLADVPVGGSASGTSDFHGQPCVVSQQTAGVVTAFSAICTHQGCTVAPAGAQFNCPCHGSTYDAFTGAVINGPATRPLTAIPVTVAAGEVTAS